MMMPLPRPSRLCLTSTLLLMVLTSWLCQLTLANNPAVQDSTAKTTSPTKLLTSKYDAAFLLSCLQPRESWKPFPPAADRHAWSALENHVLNQKRRAYLVEKADALVGQPWPALPATLYMEFVRNGNRSRYQTPYFDRRENLATLVLAECMEYRGRFLDEIANGIWAICEESSWCIPAHASRLKGDVLQRPDLETLDLFACETGMTMAQTYYLLKKELDSLSPALCMRIEREVQRRIIEPFASDRFGSKGWLGGRNNWSPWCASNVMGAAMYLEDDRERLATMVYRLLEVVDRFIDRYGSDGGCDEGPGYWNEAGGAMLVFLELLRSRSNGAIDIYDVPKIAAMGRYITRAHIAGPFFANFADADPRTTPHPGKVYRYGERINSAPLKNLALLTMRGWRVDAPVDPPLHLSGVTRAVLGPLMEIFWVPPDVRPATLGRPHHVWLPDLQVLFSRQSKSSTAGFVFAAKGGHNAESHNHNDIGHFMIFLDGQPGIIDIGRETYSRKTFSSQRYDLWFTRGRGHNAPVINGIEQRPGRSYQATDVQFQDLGHGQRLSMHLEKAYPKDAGLNTLVREFEIHHETDPRILVRDSYTTTRDKATFSITMYAGMEVKLARHGRISIACSPRPLLLEYEPGTMKCAIGPVPIVDAKLRQGWGERLYRLTFEHVSQKRTGSYTFVFRAGE